MIDIRQGDCLELLRQMPDESVHCCITSPPYFALRDYGVDGQIGLEETPEAYIAKMVEVFREVRRVLRSDGTCWVNIGDSYAAGGRGWGVAAASRTTRWGEKNGFRMPPSGCKQKDVLGIPWLLAFALRTDGWYLRQEIIWHKPSPMPESVTDRCTKSHEQIFLLTKAPRYYYDAEAIKEAAEYGDRGSSFVSEYDKETKPNLGKGPRRKSVPRGEFNGKTNAMEGREAFRAVTNSRNKRSVWTVASQPFPGSHFATFPQKLVEPMILAGTSAMGCCSACGAPLVRQTNRTKLKRSRPNDYTKRTGEEGTGNSCGNTVAGVLVETTGWAPSCECGAETVPCTVLDPFSGAATTGLVAGQLGRSYIGLELNPEYVAMSLERLKQTGAIGLFAEPPPPPATVTQQTLFGEPTP